MMEREDWEGFLRVLTYGIGQTNDPMRELDTAFNGGINRRALGGSPEQYLDAIRSGLASDIDLADVIGLRHSNAVVRAFLAAVEERLVRQIEAGQ
jgi:hypothetical protein